MAGHGDLLAGGFAGIRLALAVVAILARATGAGFARLGQPPLVGEIVAGLVLGPSVLGRLAPGVEGALFPPSVVGALDLLSRLSIVLFLFLVGLELEPRVLRRDRRVVLGIGSASVTVPFVLGGLLGLALHGSLAPAGVGQLEFSLFLGTAITGAAPRPRGSSRTRAGSWSWWCSRSGSTWA